MLGPEHVRVRRRGEKLALLPLAGAERERALELARALLATTETLVGEVRDQVELAWADVACEPRDRRLYEGLVKLVSDACAFAAPVDLEPSELRRQVFALASERRRASAEGVPFDRQSLIEEVGKGLGLAPESLERGLYADLKGAQRLEGLEPGLTPQAVLEAYDIGQLQASLLRAVRVTLTVRCAQAQGYRRLFHKLKFQRLLCRIERLPDGAHRVEVDGPFSLFESVTKYGLQLASLVPALLECDQVAIEADLRWGKQRKPLRLEHVLSGASSASPMELREDVAALLERLNAAGSPWRAEPSGDILDLPGVGLCVPDLVFERPGRERVYLEVLGFWSRDAVWRRVELVERGLGARVVFAVSSRLRVSEAVLEAGESSALYVYKGTLSPRAVLEKVESLGKTRR